VLFGESLPVQVVGPGEAGLARSLAAAVLMHNDPAECLDPWWDPESVINGKNEFSRRLRSLVPDTVKRRLRRGKDIVGRTLRSGRKGEEERESQQGGEEFAHDEGNRA
jgi:hypothetical protein